jgi:hypothetical protein
MSWSKKLGATLAAAAIAAIGLAAVPALAKTSSTLTISVYGYKGKLSSAKGDCVAERTVVLKQKAQGVLGRTKSTATGKWEIPPEELKFKGPLPYKLYAEAKPTSKCDGATSKTIEIAGG